MKSKKDSDVKNFSTVKICGIDHKIRYKDPIEMPDQLGVCHSDLQEIWLTNTNTNETMINTMLHECIHAIDYLYDLELTERQVSVLATALIAFSRDNVNTATCIFSGDYNDQKSDC